MNRRYLFKRSHVIAVICFALAIGMALGYYRGMPDDFVESPDAAVQ
jgi:hypothetical protein